MMRKSKVKRAESREDIIFKYFRLISDRDLEGLLDLFDDDATIYEPFSTSQVLHGRSSIEPFLKVALMANSNMRRKIKISKEAEPGQPDDQLTAHVTFEKGDKTKARFTFGFEPDEEKGWRIKTLHIKFVR